MTSAEIVITAVRASIFLTVFGLGLATTLDDVGYLLRRPALLARSLLSMYVIMPIIAVTVALAFDLPGTVKIALVALSISPVPPILPKKELKAGASAGYVIGLLITTAVISIVYVPLMLRFFGQLFERPIALAPTSIVKLILMTVILPLILGIVVKRFIPALADRVVHSLMLVATVLLLLGGAVLLIAAWPATRSLLGNGTALILAVVAALGTAVGHLLGGPDPANRTALALSTGSRHPAIALTVATSSGAGAQPALAAILLYAIVAALVLIPYVKWRQRESARTMTIHST